MVNLTVSDGDEVGSPAWSTKYRIISGDEGGFFNVSTGPSQLEGIITTVKVLCVAHTVCLPRQLVVMTYFSKRQFIFHLAPGL